MAMLLIHRCGTTELFIRCYFNTGEYLCDKCTKELKRKKYGRERVRNEIRLHGTQNPYLG